MEYLFRMIGRSFWWTVILPIGLLGILIASAHQGREVVAECKKVRTAIECEAFVNEVHCRNFPNADGCSR